MSPQTPSYGLRCDQDVPPTVRRVLCGTQDTSSAAHRRVSFSRKGTVPRTVLHPFSGPLALWNLAFLVSDNELACESILIGGPVLEHLLVDTITLLHNNRTAINETDCTVVGNPTGSRSGGYVSRVMTTRLNHFITETDTGGNTFTPDPMHPRLDYAMVRNEEAPFPDQSLLDRDDSEQQEEVQAATEFMVKTTHNNGLSPKDITELGKIVIQTLGASVLLLLLDRPQKFDLSNLSCIQTNSQFASTSVITLRRSLRYGRISSLTCWFRFGSSEPHLNLCLCTAHSAQTGTSIVPVHG